MIEQQSKLAAILSAAKKAKRSLAVVWIDIANAFGSVHHSLIQFALRHYYALIQFCSLPQSWYSDLSTKVLSQNGSLASVPSTLVYIKETHSVW